MALTVNSINLNIFVEALMKNYQIYKAMIIKIHF